MLKKIVILAALMMSLAAISGTAGQPFPSCYPCCGGQQC